MFDALTRQPDDPLLALIGLYRKDERPGKVDLGVGVYRDETGHTPIFRAVKAAEKRLLETQDSKAYVGPEGDLVFIDHLWTLVGGDTIDRSHIAGVQTPGVRRSQARGRPHPSDGRQAHLDRPAELAEPCEHLQDGRP